MEAIEFTYKLENIDDVAKRILSSLNSKIVLFYGDIGAGKTTLINALIKGLQSEDTATSPTFSIVNEYRLPNENAYHFDFYRIESIEEVFDIGIEDYLNSENWLFIEWPDIIISLLPEDIDIIDITTTTEKKERSLKLTINTKILTETYGSATVK